MTYRRPRDEEQEHKSFWLEFQVCSDGLSPPTSTSSLSSSPSTFPLFPNLPPELRLKIWEYLLQPRIIIVTCFDANDAPRKRHQLALRPHKRFVPILLHISAETRRLALKHYKLAFSWRISPSILAGPGRIKGGAAAAAAAAEAPPRVYFNFKTDTLLLLGELEPYDSSNMNAPMVYFLSRPDARRVVNVAVAFEELRLGEVESEEIFGTLFHVIDGFPLAERLMITSTEEDLVRQREVRGGMPLDFGLGSKENIVQKIWWGWVHGMSVVTSHLKDKQILMVKEEKLADFVAEC